MSVKMMAMAWELDIPQNELIVLLAMADHADHEGRNVRPSNGLIAWKIGSSDDTVTRIKKKLIAKGILIKEKDVRGYPVEYVLNMESVPKKSPRKMDIPQIAEPLKPAAGMPQLAGGCGSKLRGGIPHSLAGGDTAQPCGSNHQEPSLTKGDSPAPVGPNPHKQIMEWYSEDYLAFFKRKYIVSGGADGKAVKTMLARTGKTAEEIRAVWRAAFKKSGTLPARESKFWCRQSITLRGLSSRWNEILSEIGNAVIVAAPAVSGEVHI